MSNVKNYTEQGGEKTVIGGTLAFEEGARVENFPGGGGSDLEELKRTITEMQTVLADVKAKVDSLVDGNEESY